MDVIYHRDVTGEADKAAGFIGRQQNAIEVNFNAIPHPQRIQRNIAVGIRGPENPPQQFDISRFINEELHESDIAAGPHVNRLNNINRQR